MRANDDKDVTIKRQRALYRAIHRGTREMDYLLGHFAKAKVEHMDLAELAAFEVLMAIPEPVLAGALIDRAGQFEPETEEFLERIRQFHNTIL